MHDRLRAFQHQANRATQVALLSFMMMGFAAGCKHEDTGPKLEEGEEMPGGKLATTNDPTANAFGHSASGLTKEEGGQFGVGNSFFRSNWTTAPASASARDGLGPVFVATSCAACHPHDGRATAPSGPDELPTGVLFRISMPGEGPHGEPVQHPEYGDQLQVRAIAGVRPEALARVEWEKRSGTFADGLAFDLRLPKVTFSDFFHGDLAGAMVSPRIGMQIPGLGLLEAVPEGTILAFADENDRDGDSISGRPNYVHNTRTGQLALGRFGWKANQPNLEQQAAAAMNGDLGITTSLFPNQNLTGFSAAFYQNLPNGGSPEFDDANLAAMVTYLRGLAVPAPRDPLNGDVLAGKALFKSIGCGGCHRPSMYTGAHSVAAVANQKIFPYTDLLLHDMGPALADGRPDFKATGSEWRTPPLWGIGMVKVVSKATHFLHDGRARTLEEAILWHGGEAASSSQAYKKLPATERKKLLTFLENL